MGLVDYESASEYIRIWIVPSLHIFTLNKTILTTTWIIIIIIGAYVIDNGVCL
jgi:hypothetical protein